MKRIAPISVFFVVMTVAACGPASVTEDGSYDEEDYSSVSSVSTDLTGTAATAPGSLQEEDDPIEDDDLLLQSSEPASGIPL